MKDNLNHLKNRSEFILDKYLNRSYYIDENGEDDKLSIAIDCWEQILYQRLKSYDIDYKYAFCDDINFCFIENNNEYSINKSTLNLNYNLYKIHDWFNCDKSHIIESLINDGEIVAFCTMFDMLPSYCWYDKNSEGIHNRHYSVIVGYSNNYYYVADSPYVFNTTSDITHHKNSSIHLIKKVDMHKALDKFCKIKTININDKNIDKINKLEKLLPIIANNYYNEKCNKSKIGYMYIGKKAIQKFINALDDEQKFKYLKENFLISHFEIHILYSRRLILKWCIQDDVYFCKSIYYELVMKNLDKSIKEWLTLKSIVAKNNIVEIVDFRDRLKLSLLRILSIEEQLMYSIKKMITSDLLVK